MISSQEASIKTAHRDNRETGDRRLTRLRSIQADHDVSECRRSGEDFQGIGEMGERGCHLRAPLGMHWNVLTVVVMDRRTHEPGGRFTPCDSTATKSRGWWHKLTA